jgi:DNA repair protein RecN (Recombination protein N)
MVKNVSSKQIFLLDERWRDFFNDEDLDFQDLTTLRREISAAGKSRAFINDTPVRLEALKSLSEQLIDIHSQRDTAFLTNPSFFPEFLDEYGGLQDARGAYVSAWNHLQQTEKDLRAAKSAFGSDFDPSYTQFILNELQVARLTENEEEDLREELRWLSNMESIQVLYAEARACLEETSGALEQLGLLKTSLDRLARLSDHFEQAKELATSLDQTAQEVLLELEHQADRLELNPQRLSEVEARLGLIDQLQRKHRVGTIRELLELGRVWEEQLERHAEADTYREAAERRMTKNQSEVEEKAKALHEARWKEVSGVLAALHATLTEVNMSEARIDVRPEPLAACTQYGAYRYDLYFTANPGAAPMPVHKVASGGERNRLMLALKALFAQGRGLQTILLDEIDAGVSGGTAAKVAELFHSMGKHVQVIAITHLPQVAAAGSAHWRVEKSSISGKTTTGMRTLSHDERIEEVARLLAGDVITETARAQALSLLKS